MNRIKDITGERFGRWTVERLAGRICYSGAFMALWECRCDCGTMRLIPSVQLLQQRTQSCGCTQSEVHKKKAAEAAVRMVLTREIEWEAGFDPAPYLPEGGADGKDTLKVCSRCGKTLRLSEFNRNRTRPDGYACWCRACVTEERLRKRGSDLLRSRLVCPLGEGRPLPCPEKYADEHADDWMFIDEHVPAREVFVGWRITPRHGNI
jgi:hypothetical protein